MSASRNDCMSAVQQDRHVTEALQAVQHAWLTASWQVIMTTCQTDGVRSCQQESRRSGTQVGKAASKSSSLLAGRSASQSACWPDGFPGEISPMRSIGKTPATAFAFFDLRIPVTLGSRCEPILQPRGGHFRRPWDEPVDGLSAVGFGVSAGRNRMSVRA